MTDIKKIKIQDNNGVNHECEISFTKQPFCSLKIIFPDKTFFETRADDLFECLIKLRNKYKNFKFFCNGSRKDVYPSRMSRQMSNGLMAYKLISGHSTNLTDLVNIFDLYEDEQIASPEEQEKFYQNWLNSL